VRPVTETVTPDTSGNVVPLPRWAAPMFLLLATLLVPWTAYLAVSLPRSDLAHHYRIAWVGFDVLLTAALLVTGIMARRRSPRIQVPAAATATLLLVDSWFDVTMSGSKSQELEAILLAICVELPLAAVALYIAYRSPKSRGRQRQTG